MTTRHGFFDYIKRYVDSVIGENGELKGFVNEMTDRSTPLLAKQALTMPDHKQPTVLFYNLYDETGDPKYMNAINIDRTFERLKDFINYDNDGFLEINNVCIGTCVDEGTHEHYVNLDKIN